MSFVKSTILFGLFVQVCSQNLMCKQCDKSKKHLCVAEQECGTLQTKCVAIHWGAQHSRPNTYTMRCATEDECTDPGRRELCATDPDNCDAQCCSYSRCDPRVKTVFVQTFDRDHRCHHCNYESLDSCMKTEAKCDDDQDACISFLMEGGNREKVYTKRCARKNECGESYRNRLCQEEIEESERKTCRSSCCFEQLCNTATIKGLSSFAITFMAILAFIIFTI